LCINLTNPLYGSTGLQTYKGLDPSFIFERVPHFVNNIYVKDIHKKTIGWGKFFNILASPIS